MGKDYRSGWNYKNLEELGFVGRGRSRHRPRNDPSLFGGSYPLFQTGDVRAADLYLSEYKQTYNEKGLEQSKIWDRGTLLITIAANIAESAILQIQGCFPDSIVGFVPDSKKADVRYVKYALDTMKLRMQSVSHGTTQDNLSLSKLLSFRIPTPPLPTQRKIAAILSAYDDLIENNALRIAILEEMARLLYREWFVHFRFPGHEDVAMVDSELGAIPEGWEVVAYTDVADVLTGSTPRTKVEEYWNGPLPFFSPRDIDAPVYVLETERSITKLGLDNCSSDLYPKNTVFITARGTVGRLIMPAVPMAMNQTCYALRGRDGISQYYVFLDIQNQVERLRQRAHGAVFDTIIIDTFRRLKVIKPSREVIDLFHTQVAPVFEQMLNLLSRNIILRQTRDLLLPRLVSGELDVADLPIDGDPSTT